jgi:sensor histidine kinase YesM
MMATTNSSETSFTLPCLLTERSSRPWRYLMLVALMAFISIDSLTRIPPEIISNAWLMVTVFLSFVLFLYVSVTFVNIRLLAPKLLLKGRYNEFFTALLGMSLVLMLFDMLFIFLLMRWYGYSPDKASFLGRDDIMLFEIISSVAAYCISLSATAFVVLLQHWQRSGERLRDMEETGVRAELAKTRTRIDSEALFDALGAITDAAKKRTGEASRLLLNLSKSLRNQLYESAHRTADAQLTTAEENAAIARCWFVNAMTERRYKTARFAMLLLLSALVALPNFTKEFTPDDLIGFVSNFVSCFAMLCLNVYLLVPRLLLRNRLFAYLACLTVSIFLLIIPVAYEVNVFTGHNRFWLLIGILSLTVKIGFMMTGSAVAVLFQHYLRNEQHIAELAKAAMRAEVEQLQNQINPHFLFNMLNNINVLVKEAPDEAVAVLNRLNEMLKYQFNAGGKTSVLLAEDVRFLTDYLDLEKIRRDSFTFTIETEAIPATLQVPPLLFIPFVENAVKHGNDSRNPSFVHIRFALQDARLLFSCINSKPVATQHKEHANYPSETLQTHSKSGGVGLLNVRRRLDLLFDKDYSLNINNKPDIFEVVAEIKTVTG